MSRIKRRPVANKLQVLQTASLGEKRFVAVVRVGRQKFLIGGAASSVCLLANLEGRSRSNSAVLNDMVGEQVRA